MLLISLEGCCLCQGHSALAEFDAPPFGVLRLRFDGDFKSSNRDGEASVFVLGLNMTIL